MISGLMVAAAPQVAYSAGNIFTIYQIIVARIPRSTPWMTSPYQKWSHHRRIRGKIQIILYSATKTLSAAFRMILSFPASTGRNLLFILCLARAGCFNFSECFSLSVQSIAQARTSHVAPSSTELDFGDSSTIDYLHLCFNNSQVGLHQLSLLLYSSVSYQV